MPGPLPTRQPPTLTAMKRTLADGLVKAKTTRLLRYRRHRTKTPDAPVNQVAWINLADGQRRALDYDASGRLTGTSVSHPEQAPDGKRSPFGACACDLDPFTNFPGQTLHAALLGDQTVDGKPTFHLRFTVIGGPEPATIDFWIARSTHLPVRSHVVYRVTNNNGQLGPTMSTTDEFTWLPRTRANLAHLTGE